MTSKKVNLILLLVLFSCCFLYVTSAKEPVTDCCQGFQPTAAWPGPDGFGYTGNVASFSWVDISGTGTAVYLGDFDFAGPLPIGFTFFFYGTDWTDFYISSKGYISFGAGSHDLANDCPLPNANAPNNIIAVMWDDLDPGDTGDPVYYQSFTDCPVGSGQCLVVMYDNYHHWPGGFAIAGTFEAILYENGDILMQFLDAGAEEGSGSTTGIEDADAANDYGLTYVCNTAASLSDNLAILFALPDIDSEPGELDFGPVLIGSSQDLDYELWNRGNASLEVTSLEIMGEDADQFSFVSPPDLPLTLDPNTFQSITVLFEPTRLCYKDAYVQTRSNDPDEDPFTLPVLQAKGRLDRLELCEVDITDTRLLSVAGDYDFLFPGTPELAVSGTFTQDASGQLSFTGTIREEDMASSISTTGKLKIKKSTGEVYAKLKKTKVPATGATVRLALVVTNGELKMTITYKKKGMAKIVRSQLATLECTERGAQIVIDIMNEIKLGKKFEGVGTLILPCGLELPVIIKEKVKQQKDGSLKLKYSIKGKLGKKLACNLGLLVTMSSPTAETMQLQKVTKKKVSHVNNINPATVALIY